MFDYPFAQISGDGVEIEQVLVVRQRVVLPSVVIGAADAGACGDGRLPRESLASDAKVSCCHKDATAYSQSRNLRNQVASVTCSSIAPGVDELIHIALTQTDFLGDLTDDLDQIHHNAANSIDAAADLWSEAHDDATVPLPLIISARMELELQAHSLLEDRAQAAADARADGIEAGDLTPDGEPIPYPTYRAA